MNKSCNGCRALCVDTNCHYSRQGCGLGLPVKRIDGVGVQSKHPICHVVIVAPETNCRKIKTIIEAIDCGVSEFKVGNWVSSMDIAGKAGV